MSVSHVFGQNLRKLCALKPSIAGVARDLGISRVQFNRYLNGSSFPKPNLLKRVCDYFGADARIFVEPLSDAEVAALGQRLRRAVPPPRLRNPPMEDAVSFVCPQHDYFSGAAALPDGLYVIWQRAMSAAGKFLRQPVQIKSAGLSRVIRGFDAPQIYQGYGNVRKHTREFRGMVLAHREGFSLILCHALPAMTVSYMFLRPAIGQNVEQYMGYSVVGREEHPRLSRVSRCIMVRCPPGFDTILKLARDETLVGQEKVPPAILAEISLPLD